MRRVLLLVLMLALLCSCTAQTETRMQPEVDQQTVREQNMEIAERAAEAYRNEGADYWESVEPNYQPLEVTRVYWVESGYAYHSTKDCVALLRSKEILSGTLREALYAGKTHPCSKCVGS